MTYEGQVLALTRHFGKLSISPESSNGFASVGAILPKEETALLPGGLFVFVRRFSKPNWDGFRCGTKVMGKIAWGLEGTGRGPMEGV